MDLKQITYFTWVYEEGNLSGAARRANVVQSALSMQIKRLEQELSTRLFERESSGLRPTAAGEQLYSFCTSILREVAAAKEAVTGHRDISSISGKIRVGITPVLSCSVLSATLLRYFNEYPGVQVSVFEAYTGAAVEAVASGDVDFAFGVSPSPKMTNFVQRAIFQDTLVLLTGREIYGRNFEPIDLRQRSDIKLILPSAKHSFARIMHEYVETGIITPKSIVEIDGQVGAINLIRGSDWALLCPYITVCNDYYADLCLHPISNPSLSFSIYLVYDQRKPLSVAAARFVKTMEDELLASVRRRAILQIGR